VLLAFTASECATGTRIVFHVAVEARLPAAFPIATIVVVDLWAFAQEAEEGVVCGMNHNSDMPAPHNQVRRLGPRYPLKSLDPEIEIFRVRIFVRKACPLIDGMHQV